MATCPVQWWKVQRAATLEPTRRQRGLTQYSWAGIPKRKRPNCQKKETSRNSVGSAQKGGGQKEKGPENPGVAVCRGNCWYFTGVWVVMSEFDIIAPLPNDGITCATDTRLVGKRASVRGYEEVPPDLPCTSLWIKSAVGSRGESTRMPR